MTLPVPITEMKLCLPAWSLDVRHLQSTEVSIPPLQQCASDKQCKHITGFPKYMTVNLTTRPLSCGSENMAHSAHTFFSNDIDTLICRVVFV